MNIAQLDDLVGATVMLAEPDYMYGTGVLRLLIARATALRSEPGWALLEGLRVDHQGIARERREVVARVGAIERYRPTRFRPSALERPGWTAAF
jgi:hypothetical protein